jgi:hypothetical protein
MKMKQIIYFAMIVMVSTACRQELGKVILPDNYPAGIEQYMDQQKYMIMIYVDSSDCTPCSLKHLFPWDSHREKFEKNGIGILLIFRNTDERVVSRAVKLIGTFHFVFDREGKFKEDNKFYKYVKDNIFVMDRDNNVIMTESPLANEKAWESFIKIIVNRNK